MKINVSKGDAQAMTSSVQSPTPHRFETWLAPNAKGLYCAPGDFYIDPQQPVTRALITHGHSDHARPGHQAVLATPETIAIMQTRMGDACAQTFEAAVCGQTLRIGDVDVSFVPAGHIFGSAQIVIDFKGRRAVVSGDYKRRRDPTCAPFEVVRCDLFVTEATFGLPVFHHEPDHTEVAKLVASHKAFPDRTHVIGVYGLGKCQRLIALLREAGYDRPVWLHGALMTVSRLYEQWGHDLGDLRAVSEAPDKLAGEIVMCPPSAVSDRWSRRLTDPVTCFASGWMRVRARARQRGVELPLIISDHCDWPELLQSIREVEAEEVWVTHGREDALVHQVTAMGRKARALALVGRDDDAD